MKSQEPGKTKDDERTQNPEKQTGRSQKSNI